MGDIKYIQLEAGGFLNDPDFQLMNATERGIYCSIIFYMYGNDGKILNDTERIKKLCNVDENFEKSWKTVEKKFVEKSGFLTHKRVRKELAKAKKFIQRQRNAGLASAAARQPTPNHGSTTVQPQVQPNKTKERKEKKRKVFIPPTLSKVQAYIDENNYSVNAAEFIKYYAAADPPWHDQNGKPVRSWKQKLIAVWAKKPKAKKCWCGKIGVYVAQDDTQQDYWLCEGHKPQPKPLPDNIPKPQLKGVGKGKDISEERNRQKNALGVK